MRPAVARIISRGWLVLSFFILFPFFLFFCQVLVHFWQFCQRARRPIVVGFCLQFRPTRLWHPRAPCQRPDWASGTTIAGPRPVLTKILQNPPNRLLIHSTQNGQWLSLK